MALFKIFQRKKKTTVPKSEPLEESRAPEASGHAAASSFSPSPFPSDGLRMVIFWQQEWNERKVLFDSASMRPRRFSECPSVRSQDGVRSPRRGDPQMSPCGKFYIFNRKNDVKLIGEMIFGAVSMAYKGESVKIHVTRCPPQVMLTNIFSGPAIPKRYHPTISEDSCQDWTASSERSQESDNDSQYSTVRSMNDLMGTGSVARSIPLDIPERLYKRTPSPECAALAKVMSGSHPHTPTLIHSSSTSSMLNIFAHPPRPRDTSSSSNGSGSGAAGCGNSIPLAHSLQRRWLMNQSMCLEYGISRHSCDSMDDSASVTSSNGGSLGRRRAQVGMGFLVTFDDDSTSKETNELFNRFLFSHYHLIQADFVKLQKLIYKSLLARAPYLQPMYQAWMDFCHSILALYTAERLDSSVWLTVMAQSYANDDNGATSSDIPAQSGVAGSAVLSKGVPSLDADCLGHADSSGVENQGFKVERRLLEALLNVIDECDLPKDRNLFFSTMLTAVLRYHLSWVSSVAPACPNAVPQGIERKLSNSLKKPSSFGAAWAENHVSTNAYNPSTAQLMDLMGLMYNWPSKMCQTVVVGSDPDLVSTILVALSYFIRCSDIRECEIADCEEYGQFLLASRSAVTIEATLDNKQTPKSAEMILEIGKAKMEESVGNAVCGNECGSTKRVRKASALADCTAIRDSKNAMLPLVNAKDSILNKSHSRTPSSDLYFASGANEAVPPQVAAQSSTPILLPEPSCEKKPSVVQVFNPKKSKISKPDPGSACDRTRSKAVDGSPVENCNLALAKGETHTSISNFLFNPPCSPLPPKYVSHGAVENPTHISVPCSNSPLYVRGANYFESLDSLAVDLPCFRPSITGRIPPPSPASVSVSSFGSSLLLAQDLLDAHGSHRRCLHCLNESSISTCPSCHALPSSDLLGKDVKNVVDECPTTPITSSISGSGSRERKRSGMFRRRRKSWMRQQRSGSTVSSDISMDVNSGDATNSPSLASPVARTRSYSLVCVVGSSSRKSSTSTMSVSSRIRDTLRRQRSFVLGSSRANCDRENVRPENISFNSVKTFFLRNSSKKLNNNPRKHSADLSFVGDHGTSSKYRRRRLFGTGIFPSGAKEPHMRNLPDPELMRSLDQRQSRNSYVYGSDKKLANGKLFGRFRNWTAPNPLPNSRNPTCDKLLFGPDRLYGWDDCNSNCGYEANMSPDDSNPGVGCQPRPQFNIRCSDERAELDDYFDNTDPILSMLSPMQEHDHGIECTDGAAVGYAGRIADADLGSVAEPCSTADYHCETPESSIPRGVGSSADHRNRFKVITVAGGPATALSTDASAGPNDCRFDINSPSHNIDSHVANHFTAIKPPHCDTAVGLPCIPSSSSSLPSPSANPVPSSSTTTNCSLTNRAVLSNGVPWTAPCSLPSSENIHRQNHENHPPIGCESVSGGASKQFSTACIESRSLPGSVVGQSCRPSVLPLPNCDCRNCPPPSGSTGVTALPPSIRSRVSCLSATTVNFGGTALSSDVVGTCHNELCQVHAQNSTSDDFLKGADYSVHLPSDSVLPSTTLTCQAVNDFGRLVTDSTEWSHSAGKSNYCSQYHGVEAGESQCCSGPHTPDDTSPATCSHRYCDAKHKQICSENTCSLCLSIPNDVSDRLPKLASSDCSKCGSGSTEDQSAATRTASLEEKLLDFRIKRIARDGSCHYDRASDFVRHKNSAAKPSGSLVGLPLKSLVRDIGLDDESKLETLHSAEERTPRSRHSTLVKSATISEIEHSSVDSGIEVVELIEKSRRNSVHDRVFGRKCSVTSLENVECKPSGRKRSILSDLGHSLIGGYQKEYVPYMSLQGVRATSGLSLSIYNHLSSLISSNFFDDQKPAEAVCILADTADWSVRLISSADPLSAFGFRPMDNPAVSLSSSVPSCGAGLLGGAVCGNRAPSQYTMAPAHAVIMLTDNVKQLRQMGMASEFCLMYLQDWLCELYMKSVKLVRIIQDKPQTAVIVTNELADSLGCYTSDIPLLLSVVSAHSPQALLTLNID